MDLNDVHTFIQVIDQGSFSAAGRALGVPTSTVSRRVARLEDDLGVRLMQRTTRRHSLTDAGRIFYDRCAHIAEDVADAERTVAEMQARPRGRIRVTMPEGTSDQSWPILDGFLQTYPEVQLDLHLSQRFVDLVGEGFDVAIRAGAMNDASTIARKLVEVEQVLVASPEYLAARGTPERVAALADHDCVVFTPWTPRSTWTLTCVDGPEPVKVSGRVTVNHLQLVRDACLSHYGIGRTVRNMCTAALADGRLVEVLPGSCPEISTLWLVYPSRRHLSPAVRAFIDYVVERWTVG